MNKALLAKTVTMHIQYYYLVTFEYTDIYFNLIV